MSRETLKAIIVILITILASNAASSQERSVCPADAPLVTRGEASNPTDYHRPDLVNTAFVVEKIYSGRNGVLSFLVLQITNGREHFIILRSVKLPSDVTHSYDPTEVRPDLLHWGKRDRSVEADVNMLPGYSVDTGPLTLIGLEPRC
jgi:hypothetical protein